jgi:hypothetical protein
MNIQAKLNLIHDAANTKTPINAEECFKSYLRASVGVSNVEKLDPIELIDARTAYSNRLYVEFKKRADRANAA